MDPRPSLIQIGDRIINIDHIVSAELVDGSRSAVRVEFSVQSDGKPKELAFQGDEARKLWTVLQDHTTRQ